jgi:hypothetical protein
MSLLGIKNYDVLRTNIIRPLPGNTSLEFIGNIEINGNINLNLNNIIGVNRLQVANIYGYSPVTIETDLITQGNISVSGDLSIGGETITSVIGTFTGFNSIFGTVGYTDTYSLSNVTNGTKLIEFDPYTGQSFGAPREFMARVMIRGYGNLNRPDIFCQQWSWSFAAKDGSFLNNSCVETSGTSQIVTRPTANQTGTTVWIQSSYNGTLSNVSIWVQIFPYLVRL